MKTRLARSVVADELADEIYWFASRATAPGHREEPPTHGFSVQEDEEE